MSYIRWHKRLAKQLSRHADAESVRGDQLIMMCQFTAAEMDHYHRSDQCADT